MRKLIKECRSCGSEEYTGNAPCTCIYEEDKEYTIKEKDYLRLVSLARMGAIKMGTEEDKRKAHNLIEETHFKIGFKIIENLP